MTLQATFCATLVDEWVRAGVQRAVVSPGSRSAPLAIALFADGRIEISVRLDERSAAFFALGIAIDSGKPVVVLTTSGTASAELHAAVLEADLARVPLIVATADRPFELQGVGAPQTVNQARLFGDAVRFFADPGVPDHAATTSWRSFASRLVVEALTSPRGPGPVHFNLPFRDPLVGTVDALPPGRPGGRPWHEAVVDRAAGPASVSRLLEEIRGKRGVVIVGGSLPGETGAVLAHFSERIGWPVVADARALSRDLRGSVIAHADGIVRSHAALGRLAPEVVVHVASPHASKVLGQWCEALADRGVPQVLIDPYGSFEDPERDASLVVRADPTSLFSAIEAEIGEGDAAPETWLEWWVAADRAVEDALSELVDEPGRLTEPAIARAVVRAMRPGSVLFASSSMPVRDLEWYGAPRIAPPRVVSNRGANGIDGVGSTALGLATSANSRGGEVVAIIGDLAFLYDLSALVFGVHEHVPNATLVVVDNGGGGIFSFLPYPGVIDAEMFERAFGTPQRPDIAATARGLGHRVVEVASLEEITREIENPTPGITVVVCSTDRSANVEIHDALSARLVEAVDGAPFDLRR